MCTSYIKPEILRQSLIAIEVWLYPPALIIIAEQLLRFLCMILIISASGLTETLLI